MTKQHLNADARARLALELTMRDALDGLEELVSLDVYRVDSGCFEILGIERPTPALAPLRAITGQAQPANILTFPEKRRRVG